MWGPGWAPPAPQYFENTPPSSREGQLWGHIYPFPKLSSKTRDADLRPRSACEQPYGFINDALRGTYTFDALAKERS